MAQTTRLASFGRRQPPCCVLVHCHVKTTHRLVFVARVGCCCVVVWLWLWLRREWECDVM